MRSAETSMQVSLRNDQVSKREVRRGFWEAIATGISSGDEEAGTPTTAPGTEER